MTSRDELREKVKHLSCKVTMDDKRVHVITVKLPDSHVDAIMALIDQQVREARRDERAEVALDNYRGHTFSDSTNWKAKYEKFIENNERRIAQLSPSQGDKDA